MPAPQVAVEDSRGVVVSGANNLITLGLGSNPNNAGLSGTLQLAANQGLLTFSDLSINAPGSAVTLSASSPGLSEGDSTAFEVFNDQTDPNAPTGQPGDNGDTLGIPNNE